MWLRRKIRNWLMTDDICSNDAPYFKGGNRATGAPSVIGGSNSGINFTVYQADGGKIVQTSSYDMRTDRHSTQLYIIKDNEPFGQELELIIAKEYLSR